jgi:hypothetical protein
MNDLGQFRGVDRLVRRQVGDEEQDIGVVLIPVRQLGHELRDPRVRRPTGKVHCRLWCFVSTHVHHWSGSAAPDHLPVHTIDTLPPLLGKAERTEGVCKDRETRLGGVREDVVRGDAGDKWTRRQHHQRLRRMLDLDRPVVSVVTVHQRICDCFSNSDEWIVLDLYLLT